MEIRDRIHPQLLSWYELSPGFDFDHLEEFVAKCNEAELRNRKEDPEVSVRDDKIPGPRNAPMVKIRVYEPKKRKDALLPCVFFYHGGGFLFGTVYRQEALCQRYVKNVDCVVVSVDYRLAPKWKTPAPLEDCYAALCYIHDNGEKYGVDASRLAVCGLSAGGNLAAAVSLLARDRKGPNICLQIPLYAELDPALDSPSALEITDAKVWCRDNCEKSWAKFLNPGKMPDGYDAPALAKNVQNLPPLFSFIGQLDPGRDENIEYWSRLMQAGVPVEYHVFPGCYHCFELSVPEADFSRKAYELTYNALRRAFAKDGMPPTLRFPGTTFPERGKGLP